MKKILLICLSMIAFNSLCIAQFNDPSKYYVYIPVGESIDGGRDAGVYMQSARFNTDGDLITNNNVYLGLAEVKESVSKGKLDELIRFKSKYTYKYCINTSTNKYKVYKLKRSVQEYVPFGPFSPVPSHYETRYIGGYWFAAFSYDLNELITWYTTDSSNEPLDKTYYKRLNPDDLKPKEVDYDFLY